MDKIKNILVTGGSGKIGRNLIPELLKGGYRVRVLEFEPEPPPYDASQVEIVRGALGTPGLAERLIRDMDAVIHLANVKERKDLFVKANIQGTFDLLDACRAAGKQIKQFIQAGSDARAGIYYNPRPYPIDENFPHSAYPGYYAFSKVLEETMCEQYRYQYGLPITVLRFSWVHGEDDILAHATTAEPDFGVPAWRELATTAEHRSYFEAGQNAACCMVHPDGKPCMRHIVALEDVIHGCLQALGNPAAIGHAFAIAGPSAFTYDVLSRYISEKLDIPAVDFVNPEYYDFQHDLSKSRSILGYRPTYDIVKIVDQAIAYRKQGKTRSLCKYPG
ncbi:MAG: NAD(P)-dependent oxidoreductase [Victivallaceae bacterium]|nr:NAD(P)-dependent oxidoreductase [Victivallaceae bacterium]